MELNLAYSNLDAHPRQQDQKPEWIDSILEATFFEICQVHEPPRNVQRMYCFDCKTPGCDQCMNDPHKGHRQIKIYRYSTKDAVLLSEMEKYLDCSQIQPYKSNRQLVVALTPLSRSSSQRNEQGTCNVCKRKLLHPDVNKYCSIACKVQAFSRKENGTEPPFLAVRSPLPGRKRGRKGVPRRAPSA